VNLEVKAGEIHAIMGPNGSGKSNVLTVGRASSLQGYRRRDLPGQNLLEMEPEERAKAMCFWRFSTRWKFRARAIWISCVWHTTPQSSMVLEELDSFDFDEVVQSKLEVVNDPAFLSRSVNEEVFQGEKKRNEILQMALLEPKVAILDETDSGL